MKNFFSFVCLSLLLVGIVFGDCEEAGTICSEHGVCEEGVCHCDPNWAGDDCSIYDKYLNSGERAVDSVGAKQWKFYRHDVDTDGATLTWWLNLTGDLNADPDLYVQYNDYPSLKSFLTRNLTRSSSTSLNLESLRAGTYYAGVYGYSSAEYNIKVVESRGCEDDCFGHGECHDAKCECYSTFAGDFCEYPYQELKTSATPILGQVEKKQWSYFYTNVEITGSDLVYTATELDDDSLADCDIYVRYEALPTLWEFDYVNVTLGDTSTVRITDVNAGKYNVGIYGYTACSFRLGVIITSDSCPNRCSEHGNCVDDECDCFNGFDGDVCETMTAPLPLVHPVGGFVGERSWNYFNTHVISNSPLLVNLTELGDETVDCDLYIRADELPSRFQYSYADFSLEKDVSIMISEPGDHLWYIGVYGWHDCQYSLVLDMEQVCSCGENNPHGSCEAGKTTCVCEEGWAGPSCSETLQTLQNGVKVHSSVGQYEFKYFKLEVESSSAGVISMKENNSVGFLWLFVSFLEPPTLTNFDDSVKETTTNVHEIQISVDEPQSRVMYVGVYGSSLITHEEEEFEFDLYLWAAPF